MGRDTKRLIGLFSRYILMFLLGLGNLALFYAALTPITVALLSAVLSLSREVVVEGTYILWGHITISVVPACVAGAAFYLMFILVFSTADIPVKKRLFMLAISVVALFVLNMLRMLVLVLLIGQPFFVIVHWFLWNIISTIFVVLIWLVMIKKYDVQSIPIYSDFKYLYSLMKESKQSQA